MTKTFPRACRTLLIPLLCLGLTNASAQQPAKISPAELATKLFAPQRLPQIQLKGRFEFFSASERPTLEPSSSADFTGETHLGSRRTHFDFKDYKSPVYQSPEPALHTFYSVTFDGEKWVVIDSGSRIDALPSGITALGEITADHPRLFLKSLDHLCFPLFASLLNVQVGGAKQAPLRDVLEGKAAGAAVTTTVVGASLVLTVKKDLVTDTLTFDPAKGYALTRRRTDFGPKTSPMDNTIINELTVTEFIPAGGFWFPKEAEFTQMVKGKVEIKRDYHIETVAVSPDPKPIEAVIPPNTYVRDERTGENHRTGPAAN